MVEMKPYHDCPTCPECKLPVGISGAIGLLCPACGHRWEGTADERYQAARADAAWIKECRVRAFPVVEAGSNY